MQGTRARRRCAGGFVDRARPQRPPLDHRKPHTPTWYVCVCSYSTTPPAHHLHITDTTTTPAANVRPVKPELTDLLHVFNSPPGAFTMPLVGLTPSPLGGLAAPPSLQDEDLWGKLDAPLGGGDAGALGYGPSAMFD